MEVRHDALDNPVATLGLRGVSEQADAHDRHGGEQRAVQDGAAADLTRQDATIQRMQVWFPESRVCSKTLVS